MDVKITAEAKDQLQATPLTIHARILDVFERLRDWPDVSGAKPLRKGLKGHFRIRTGDWRLIFRTERDRDGELFVLIVKIDNRRDVYEG